MNRIIKILAIATCFLSIVESHAQRVIKDAAGAVYIDVTDMLPSTYSITSLNKVTVSSNAGNSIYKKFQIAKMNMSSQLSFADALGIASNYNSTSAAGQSQGQISKGCSTYNTEGNVGSWRVPTQRELQIIYLLKDILREYNILFTGEHMWSSTETDVSNGFYVNFKDNLMNGNQKTNTLSVRCIREVN